MDKKPMDEKVDPTRRPPLPGDAREAGPAQAEPLARKAPPEIPAPAVSPPPKESTPEPRRRRSFFGFLIGLIIIGGLGYYGYRVFAPAPATHTHGQRAGGAPQSVGVATIGTGDIKIIYGGLGTVTPLATITVRTQINGTLMEVPFKEGQYVKKGDLLAQIDDRPYKLLKAQYQGQLAHDQGLLQQAQADLVRYQTLVAQNSIAKQQAEDQFYIVKQYQGSVQTDQAQIDTESLNIAYCHITAPVTGRVGLRLVDPGNYVQTSDTTGIAVVTQLQPISVIFSLPEDDIPDVMAQMKGATPLPATVYDRANVHELGTGDVTVLDNQIDTTTGMVKFRAEFPNADESLFPSQFVNVQVLARTLKNVITAPVPAIQRGAPGTFVYLVNADNTVSVRKVELGPSEGNMVQILSGLKPGDRVVTDGTDRLTDGAKVFVPGAQSTAAAQGASGHHPHHQRNPE
jgi:membrane fusion protein, multidrug efflux system